MTPRSARSRKGSTSPGTSSPRSCRTACRCASCRSARPAPRSHATWWHSAILPAFTACRARLSTRPSLRSSRARPRRSPRATSRRSMPATPRARRPSGSTSTSSARRPRAAATATSGPGLALMTEMLGLGVMAEVPAVIFVSQRGGPSTGMPTKTEQSDLNLAVFGGSGDAPRIVLAPTNVEGCYKCAGKAFELAEKYQTPVIVLLDLYLSNRLEAVTLPVKSPFAPNLAKGMSARDRAGDYARFAITDDHISPRALPGQEGGIHTVTGLEHTEAGRPKDTPEVHTLMTEKRHKKLASAVRHPELTIAKRFGDEGRVDVGILAWGSTFGEALEAMLEARREGIRCAAMKVVMLSPLPVEAIRSFCDDCREILVPELNYQGQFANLVTAATARAVHRLDRVSGRPMHVEDIVMEIRRLGGSPRQIAAE